MNSTLPAKFLKKMEILLGDEFDNFMASYENGRLYGVRINPLKLSLEQWHDITPIKDGVRSIEWTGNGFYYGETERPGTHPYYHAGLYYIQEPSAMLPVELLDVRPGQRVLDLCAAPGGKSTQIAGKLGGEGVLVCNDNAFERTKALTKNVELAGVRNAIITNEEPDKLASVFREWFHRILVDAPCSGEGMFRKDESMAADWEKHSVERCVVMQRDILSQAASMLAPGGLLVYSTCTFSPEENENQIAGFLAAHPEFTIQKIPALWGLRPGRPDWIDNGIRHQLGADDAQSLAGTVRIWPHVMAGEGHFAAVLRKGGECAPIGMRQGEAAVGQPEERFQSAGAKRTNSDRRKDAAKASLKRRDSKGSGSSADQDPVSLWHDFANQHLRMAIPGISRAVAFGNRVYLQPKDLPALDGVRIVRAGWYVGEARRNRFEPSQPLAMGLVREQCARSISFGADSDETARYLRGETLFVESAELRVADGAASKGYTLVCVDGFPLGWGKYADGMLKNELYAGWRRM